jgi:uncharacterized protein
MTNPSKGNTVASLSTAVPAGGPAPLERWNPPYCGDIGLEIRGDCSWWHQGSAIDRPALVKLFASVLRKDDDEQTYLVTPAEKILVTVADAHFLAVEMVIDGEGREQVIKLRTNLDDWICVDAKHPLRFKTQAETGGLKPYVRVRGRLDALLTRSVTLDLTALAVDANVDRQTLGVWSSGLWWSFDALTVG